VAHVAEMLARNQGLLDIDLTSNEVGDQGATSLANALKHNTSLKRVRFYLCQSTVAIDCFQ
jgi:hypothetical protein